MPGGLGGDIQGLQQLTQTMTEARGRPPRRRDRYRAAEQPARESCGRASAPVGARVLGTVMNNVKAVKGGYYYGYKYE